MKKQAFYKQLSVSGKYRFYYFDQSGLGDAARLILEQAAADYDDVRISRPDEWNNEWKHQPDKVPMGALPVLELPTGERLTQSVTICRYLGEVFDLQPLSLMARTRAEQLVEASEKDLFNWTTALVHIDDVEQRRAKHAQMMDAFVNPRTDWFEDYLAKRTTKFLVSDQVTWVDFVVYQHFYMALRDWLGLPLKPQADQFCQLMLRLPAVQAFYCRYPDRPWTRVDYGIRF